ncbi:hypothetical protein KIN20_027809 [Parelaphostrongylus tenuis]|uniref:Uncharacterized protein n=1 Tax=Parelaphostrongylus tenuis TaxID=148309 RepID=A0AAD5WE86_PARTN|nr:hypothetical protein KIN20_027809 [Parelaphostrongylus tenuis]
MDPGDRANFRDDFIMDGLLQEDSSTSRRGSSDRIFSGITSQKKVLKMQVHEIMKHGSLKKNGTPYAVDDAPQSSECDKRKKQTERVYRKRLVKTCSTGKGEEIDGETQ